MKSYMGCSPAEPTSQYSSGFAWEVCASEVLTKIHTCLFLIYQIQTEELTWVSLLGPVTGPGFLKQDYYCYARHHDFAYFLSSSSQFCGLQTKFSWRLGILLEVEAVCCGSTTITIHRLSGKGLNLEMEYCLPVQNSRDSGCSFSFNLLFCQQSRNIEKTIIFTNRTV